MFTIKEMLKLKSEFVFVPSAKFKQYRMFWVELDDHVMVSGPFSKGISTADEVIGDNSSFRDDEEFESIQNC